MTEHKIPIPSRIYNASGGNVCGTDDVIDDVKGKNQSQINTELNNAIQNEIERATEAENDRYTKSEVYKKEETYNKNELNNLITTPEVNYVNVEATDQTTDISDVLPATGAANTIYKIGCWDGSQYDASKYSEYTWNGSTYVYLATRDHGVDDKPIVGSNNLVKSGGVERNYLPTPYEVVSGYVTSVGIVGAGGLWETHKYRLEQGKLLLENNIVLANNGLAVGFFNDYDTINNNTFIGSFNESAHDVEIPRGTKCVCISYHPTNAPTEVVNFTPVNSENKSLPIESKIVAGYINQFGTIANAGGTWITKIFRYHGGYITINGEGIETLDVDIAFYSDYDNPSQHNVISLYKRTAYTQEFLVPAGAVCFAITTKSNNDNINKVVSFSPNNEQRFIDAENYHKEYIKGNVICKPFSFNGKTATFVGDSITRGYTTGATITNENYVKIFCERVGLSADNRALGGAAFSYGYNQVLTLKEQMEQSPINTDYLFVSGGVNDWQLFVPDADFRQAVKDTCDYIQEHFNGTVIFLTPINCIRTNSNPLPLDYYTSTIIEIAAGYGFNVVCGTYFPFPSKSGVADAVFGDNIHPSELGYKIFAGSLQSVLC